MSLMCRWYLAYAYTPESSRGFSTFIQCWLSHSCHLSLLQLHTLSLPLCKRKELQLLLFYRLRKLAWPDRSFICSTCTRTSPNTDVSMSLSMAGRGHMAWKPTMILNSLPWLLSCRIPICVTCGQTEPYTWFPRSQDTHRRLQGLGGKNHHPKTKPKKPPKSPKHLTSITRVPWDKKIKIHFCFTCFL